MNAKNRGYVRSVEHERARDLILRYGWNSMAYQVLNPGMSLWFSRWHEGVIGYVETSTHIVAAGSPISHENDLMEIIHEFFQYVSRRKKKICFFGAQQRISRILLQFTPTSSIFLGSQPTWSPAEWLFTINEKPSLRAQIHRAHHKHVIVRIVKETSSEERADIQRCLREWSTSRHAPLMHFLVEPITIENLEDRILCVAEKDHRVVGFCIASPIPLRNGWLIEQFVKGLNAPNGTTELLLETTIQEIQCRNGKFVTLGLSPLSPHAMEQTSGPLWLRLCLQIIRRRGKVLFNFDGLHWFKAKFSPTGWEPIFAITNESRPTVGTLFAIASAFTGGSPVSFVLKGMIHARKKNASIH